MVHNVNGISSKVVQRRLAQLSMAALLKGFLSVDFGRRIGMLASRCCCSPHLPLEKSRSSKWIWWKVFFKDKDRYAF